MTNLGVKAIGKTVLKAALTGTQKGILIGGGAGMAVGALTVGVSSMIKKKKANKVKEEANKEPNNYDDYCEVEEEEKKEEPKETVKEEKTEENKAS